MGANDLFNAVEHSYLEPKEVADLLIRLAIKLKSFCTHFYIIGISIRTDSIHKN